ncbi:endonuclease [Bacillus phage YungSlug]|nr:endonuclease [Bacillus phage YungSlug]
MLFIYKITNIKSNKVYIGQTHKFKSRKAKHIRKLKAGEHRIESLQKDWDSYGETNFSFDVIKECTPEEADELERYYVRLFNATNSNYGYNSESGGIIGTNHSEKSKRKMSDAHKNLDNPEKRSKRLSELHKGKEISEEQRKLISDKNAGEGNGRALLTTVEVLEILSELKKGKSLTELAERFGVKRRVIRRIKNGETWAHVKTKED